MDFPNVVGFDIETAGDRQEYALQPYRLTEGTARITAASWAYNNKVVGELTPTTRSLRNMLQKAIDNDLYVLGWNVSFDAAWCVAAGCEAEVMQVKWLDAMLLWRHWYIEPEGENVPRKQRKSYAMKAALKEFFPDDNDFKKFDDFQAYDKASLERLLMRNKGDALFTVKLAEIFWSRLTDKQQICSLIEARCIPMVAKTKVMGIKSDKEKAKVLSKVLKQQAEELYKSLVTASPETEGLNLGSSKQLQKLLFETWGLPVQGVSKKTQKPSTDKFALFALASIDPRAKEIKELREHKNNRTKYAEATIKSLDYNGDGYVRPGARIFGTYTSRMTYSSQDESKVVEEKTTKALGLHTVEVKRKIPVGVALHQWKRGKEYRDLVQAPPGYVLTEFDFAGQEFRWMAVASEDDTMLGLCADGEDAHSYMGAQVSGCEYRELTKLVGEGDAKAALLRKGGKFCNLSYQYRVSAKTATQKARVDYGLDVHLEFIQHSQNIYKSTYVGVEHYWQSQIIKCRQLGYAETYAGRRVQLTGDWAGQNKWPSESTAINYPIQGTGGDQKYLALAVARNHLPEFGGLFYYELHDGLFFIFPEDKVDAAVPFFREKLSNLPYKQAWGVDLPIAFPVDSKKGASWGELKEIK